MGKTCVLFGAGAEEPLGICSGAEFARAVIGRGEKYDEMNQAIKSHYQELFNSFVKTNGSSWYPSFCDEKTNWQEAELIRAAVQKEYLHKFANNELQNKTKTDFENGIKEKAKEVNKYSEAAKEGYLNDNSSLVGLIDSDFYTLISPKVLGPRKFWRVVLCYTRAYCFILGKMSDSQTSDDYRKILSDPQCVQHIMRQYADRYLSKSNNDYYRIIKKRISSSAPDNNSNKSCNIRIVTTNYTSLCSNIAGITDSDIAYVHGKFGWFESVKDLSVFQHGYPKNDIVFPYIFIQSGIKPIVEPIQLKQYSKMINYLENSDRLLIIGYQLNVDDTHIVAILRNAICHGLKTVFFDYDSQLGRTELLRRLRLIETDSVDMEYVAINKNNCFSTFNQYLDD